MCFKQKKRKIKLTFIETKKTTKRTKKSFTGQIRESTNVCELQQSADVT